MQDTHDSPLCAALGHYVAGITVAYCPHHQAHILMVRAGDESDDTSWRFSRMDFGPFDDLETVEAEAVAEVRRLLRADRSAWVAARRER